MSLFLDNASISKLYLGSVHIDKAYLGSSLVWGVTGTSYTISVNVLGTALTLGSAQFAKGFGISATGLALTYSSGNVNFAIGRKFTGTVLNMTYTLGNANLKRGYTLAGTVLATTVTYGSANLTKTTAAAVTVRNYTVVLTKTGGGSVTFTMLSDGSTTGDEQGWYTPVTAGAGTGRWVILTSAAGAMTVSGTIGSRVQLSTNPSWTGTYSGGSVRSRTFTVNVYDAATGGTLLGSGTLYLEIDGS